MSQESPEKESLEKASESPSIAERPRICLIDVPLECAEGLKARGFNCYSGTLGPQVEVPNEKRNDSVYCLPNFDFPPNLHEYDIVVIDLQVDNTVAYVEEDHVNTRTKGSMESVFLSSFPERLFDSRALSASILKSKLEPFMEKESILVVFAAENERIKYQRVALTSDRPQMVGSATYSLYAFFEGLPEFKNLTGRDTSVVLKDASELRSLLERHNREAAYSISFRHPTVQSGRKSLKDNNFLPLMVSTPHEIVAYSWRRNNNLAVFFPHISGKKTFLIDLFEKALPDIVPGLFPDAREFVWIKAPLYRLPNENDLLQQKHQLEAEYSKRVREIDERIDANRQEFGFLHDLLKQSGSVLVKAVETFLTWLEFDNVVNVDETEPKLREEDLRIETDRGLLVIEVKGLGGTSTDSDCSQISKIRYRRMKERKPLDVFGLYLVNHQRYLPPEQRTNPPFNETQIEDAKNDDRGLLTTYDLFKLYFSVTDRLISKEDAREAFFGFGLVRFQPSDADKLAGPFEIRHGGYVVIFRVDALTVKTGMSVVLCDEGRCRAAEVLEVQDENEPVEEVSSGEVGIKLSERVSKETEIWLRRDTQ